MVRSNSLDSCYSSIQDVTYSCGYCGYALNLSSGARNTAGIGSKYGKHIRKGVVAFVAVDETRFTQAHEVTCAPRLLRPWTWRLFRRRSRLLCANCGGRIGAAYEVDDDEDPAGLSACAASDDDDDDPRTSPGDTSGCAAASRRRSYLIRIGALQPSTDDPPAAAHPFSL